MIVKCLKNPSRYFGRKQIGQKFIFFITFFFESTIETLAIRPIRFRYLVDCIHCEIFFWKKCNSENMAKNVAAKFPPDLELQYRLAWAKGSKEQCIFYAPPMVLINDFQKQFWFQVLEDLSQDVVKHKSWERSSSTRNQNSFSNSFTMVIRGWNMYCS